MVKCLGRWGKHSIKHETREPTGAGIPAETGNVSNTHKQGGDQEPRDDEGSDDLEICCLSGCLTTITVGILFFLALPTGVLLCVFATTNNDPEVLAVGIVLAISPIISLPLIVVVLYNRRRIRRLRKRKVASSPIHAQTYRQRY